MIKLRYFSAEKEGFVICYFFTFEDLSVFLCKHSDDFELDNHFMKVSCEE